MWIDLHRIRKKDAGHKRAAGNLALNITSFRLVDIMKELNLWRFFHILRSQELQAQVGRLHHYMRPHNVRILLSPVLPIVLSYPRIYYKRLFVLTVLSLCPPLPVQARGDGHFTSATTSNNYILLLRLRLPHPIRNHLRQHHREFHEARVLVAIIPWGLED